MAREAFLTIATGVKGVGKSYLSRKIVYAYSRGIPENNFYPRKVLIFDINNESQYFEPDPSDKEGIKLFQGKEMRINALDINDIPIFTAQKNAEIRRIAPIHLHDIRDKKGKLIARAGDEWDTNYATHYLLTVLKEYRGGLLLIEDLNSFFGDHIPQDVMAIITRNRHRDLDIIVHLQSVSPILPRFWQNCQWTRFHNQIDGIDASKHKLKEKFMMYKIAEKLVKYQYNNGNERYHVWINNLRQHITGNITPDMAKYAIKEYLSENYGEIKNLQNKRNDDGKLINNYSAAMQIRTKQLYNQYFPTLS